MSLKNCFKSLGKALDKKDKAAIEGLVKSGLSETDAITSYTASIQDELKTIAKLAEKKGAEVKRVGDAAKAAEPRSQQPLIPQTRAQEMLYTAEAELNELKAQRATDYRAGKKPDAAEYKAKRTQIEYRVTQAKKHVAAERRASTAQRKANRKTLTPKQKLDNAIARYDKAKVKADAHVASEEALLADGTKVDDSDLYAAEALRNEELAKASKSIDRARKKHLEAKQAPADVDAAVDDSSNDGGTGGTGSSSDDGGAAVRPMHEANTYGRKENFIRFWQDKFMPVLQTQRAIAKVKGSSATALSDDVNTYRAEELMTAKAKQEFDTILEKFVDPLAKLMKKANINRKQLDNYLVAKYAPDRNQTINERAVDRPELIDSGSGMSNEEAQSVIDAVEEAGMTKDMDAAAEYVYGMLQAQRDRMKENLVNKDEVEFWESQSKFYVPLKGTDETGKPEGVGFKGLDVRGKVTFKAMGRTTMPHSPLSYAIKDVSDTVFAHHRNEVGNTFLKLVQQNPHPDWKVIKASPTSPKYSEAEYFGTKKDGQQYYIRVKDQKLLAALNGMGLESQSTLMKMMGKVVRVMSALNTSWNPEFILGNFPRDVQTAAFTVLAEQDIAEGRVKDSKIVKQMLKGIPRSGQAIAATRMGKELAPGHPAYDHQQMYNEFLEHGAQIGWADLNAIDGHMRNFDNLLLEAQGGVKGNALKAQKMATAILEGANTTVENATRLAVYKAARELKNADGTQKYTADQAASLSKNLTVNFTRKGEAGWLSSVYMFANASVQGTAIFARSIAVRKTNADGSKSLNGAQKLALGVMAGSFALSSLNRMFAGEDDDGRNWFDKVPEYERERNIIFMKSIFGGPADGTYFKIPLPYGFNVFHVIGDTAEGVISGDKELPAGIAHIASSFIGSFSPLGMNEASGPSTWAVKTFTPTVLQPVAQIGINENYFGSEIYRANFPMGRQKPVSQLGKHRTSEHWKNVAKWLNDVSGGSEFVPGAIDINPDAISHLIQQYAGGAGQLGVRTYNFLEKLSDGKEIQAREIPFARKLSGQILPYEDINTFKKRHTLTEQLSAEYKSLRGLPRQKFRRDHFELELVGFAKSTKKRVKKLSKLSIEIDNDDSMTVAERADKIKELELKRKAIIDRFNSRWNELSER